MTKFGLTKADLNDPAVLKAFWATTLHIRARINELYQQEFAEDVDPDYTEGYDAAILDVRSWLDQILVQLPVNREGR